VDESGEDYLFSADRFVAIDVPEAVRSLLKTSSRSRPARLEVDEYNGFGPALS